MLIFILILFIGTRCSTYLLLRSEFYHAAYGEFWKFDDLFLPNDTLNQEEAMNVTKDTRKSIQDRVKDLDDLFDVSYQINSPEDFIEALKEPIDGGVMKEFNAVNQDLYNATRKRFRVWFPFDWAYNDWYDPHVSESTKMEQVKKLCLQFLIHARYKIDRAMKQREPIRDDKRFQLGYLFNRLRRLTTEMHKVASVAKIQKETWWNRKVDSLIRLYETVVRFDTDVRDTILLIKEVYARPAAFDSYVVARLQKRKDRETAGGPDEGGPGGPGEGGPDGSPQGGPDGSPQGGPPMPPAA